MIHVMKRSPAAWKATFHEQVTRRWLEGETVVFGRVHERELSVAVSLPAQSSAIDTSVQCDGLHRTKKGCATLQMACWLAQ